MAQERTENRRVTFRIDAHLGVLSEGKDGYTKELNLVSWNGAQSPKYDIRDWSPDHKKMSKGITLYEFEMDKACQYYLDYCNAKMVAINKSRRNAAAEAGLRAGEEEREREDREREAENKRIEAEKKEQAQDAAGAFEQTPSVEKAGNEEAGRTADDDSASLEAAQEEAAYAAEQGAAEETPF